MLYVDPVDENRPNPDDVLAAVQRGDAKARRGRLKIFFGMCPGVGKTYAMLEDARRKVSEGVEVVVGIVETHGRAETLAMIEGLPVAPRLSIEHRGAMLTELDLDALLAWRPKLVLIDELAHTNAPGSRHPKRYQDVLEILDAGIDVFTTLNVQHIESRAGAVRQITGITVRETVPDSLLDTADEIELIDLTPEQLQMRLSEGKVYVGERAAAASENFFRPENLTALREMALRITAEHVDRGLRAMLRGQRVVDPWQNTARMMVGVGPSPHAEALIRWTRRAASAINAPWIAVNIELPHPLDPEAQTRLARNLTLARRLGAEVLTVPGSAIGPALLDLARRHQATQLVLGKPGGSPWRELFGLSPVRWLIRHSGGIDVHLVRAGESEPRFLPFPRVGGTAREYGMVVFLVGVVTMACLPLLSLVGYWTVALIYLLAVMLSALKLSRWPTLACAALSALAWNFLFIPPRFTFLIHEIHDMVMFGTFFVVALAIGQLTTRLREREAAEQRRERNAFVLYRLTRAFSIAPDTDSALAAAVAELKAAFGSECAFLIRDAKGEFPGTAHPASTLRLNAKEESVAAWAFQKRQPAGRHTDTLPDATALYVPMLASERAEGVLAVNLETQPTPNQRDLLEACAAQLAVFLERERALASGRKAKVLEESERLQRALFDSVSHELKTPLSAIAAALDQPQPDLTEIARANDRLRRTVEMLLDATRLESGLLSPKPEWCDVTEIVLNARTRAGLESDGIAFDIACDLPPVRTDPGLASQAIAMLFSNAVTHGTPHEPPVCKVARDGENLRFEVNDRGPGLAAGAERVIFEKFTRGAAAGTGGLGLGLSVAQRLASALGATLAAENRPAGGARFTFLLPIGGEMKLPA